MCIILKLRYCEQMSLCSIFGFKINSEPFKFKKKDNISLEINRSLNNINTKAKVFAVL